MTVCPLWGTDLSAITELSTVSFSLKFLSILQCTSVCFRYMIPCPVSMSPLPHICMCACLSLQSKEDLLAYWPQLLPQTLFRNFVSSASESPNPEVFGLQLHCRQSILNYNSDSVIEKECYSGMLDCVLKFILCRTDFFILLSFDYMWPFSCLLVNLVY